MKNSLKQLALFVSLVYDWFWHEAPLSIQMPLSNMQLLELLTNFPNRTVVKTARNTFSRHLWHFSEMLVGLSFFDDRIGRCNNADGGKPPDCEESVKRLDSPPEPLSVCGLASCVTETSATRTERCSTAGQSSWEVRARDAVTTRSSLAQG